MRKLSLVVLFAMSLLIAQQCWAQSTNQAAVVGTVVDPDGRAVPEVNITLIEGATGATRSGVTNNQGDYRVDFVLPGKYTITAERTGFKKTELTNVLVQVGQLQRVDVTLSVGQITEQISVSAESSPINSDSGTLGEVIDNRKIQNLPLNGREFIHLAVLVPGAHVGNPKLGPPGHQKGVSFGFNGARATQNAYFVDGADSTDANYNQLISSPALDAIKEFRVETNLYSAQYGRSGGGVINAVTVSGTNSFHGSLYEYHRNKWLDAAPVLNPQPYDLRPRFLFNQYGASVGGPVGLPRFGEGGPGVKLLKNKTFFFFSIERYHQVKPGDLLLAFAPTDKERVGDLTQTINPFTGQPVQLRNPFTGQPIPGNIVPKSLINPVGQTLMDLWQPRPNDPSDPFLNLRVFRSGAFTQQKWLLRIDHHFSEKDTVSGTYNFGDYDNTSVNFTKYGDRNDYDHDRTFGLTYTHVFTNNLVNDFKFSRIHFLQGRDYLFNDKNYGKEWGMYTTSTGKGPPRVLIYTLNYNYFEIGAGGGSNRDNHNYYFKDNLVWVKGNHTFSFGGDYKRQNYDWLFEGTGPVGAYYFGLLEGDPVYDSYYGATGSVFSSVLMGVSSYQDYSLQKGQPNQLRRNMFAAFVQDDWKVKPRLTLNLGLRYDYEAPFSEVSNKFMSLNFQTGKPRYAAGAPKLDLLKFPYEADGPNRPFEPNKLSLAPRVGFAFRPFSDNRTALRGGYGIYYTSETAYSTVYGSWVAPFAGQFGYSGKAWFQGTPTDHLVTLDQQPYNLEAAIGKTPGFALINAPEFPQGYIQQWNLTLSRDLGKNFALEVGYVGTKGTNLNGNVSLGSYDPSLPAKVVKWVSWGPGIRIKGFNSKYNSLQAKLTKRLSNGLSFLAAFTWGHAMAEASNDDYVDGVYSDATLVTGNFIQRKYGNADFDQKRRFVLSGDYELPFGTGKTFGTNWGKTTDSLIGGWNLYYIYQLQDGFPYTVFNSSLRLPDRICDGKLPKSQRNSEVWFDYKCFPDHPTQVVTGPNGQPITLGVNGNSGVNIITTPGFNNLDMGLHKNFRITESTSFQLRFEAFNLLNHPNLLGPNGYFFNTPSGTKITRQRDNRDIQVAIKFLF